MTNRFLWLFFLALGLLFALGCSGNSITQPTFDADRALTMGGNGGGGNPNCPPGGKNDDPYQPKGPGCPGWDPDFKYDCESIFKTNYAVTMPDGKEFDATGKIRILDSDCSAPESKVLTGFFMILDLPKNVMPGFYIPGVKTTTNTGLLYKGEIAKEFGNEFMKTKCLLGYKLNVFDKVESNTGDVTTYVQGVYFRHMVVVFYDNSGNEVKKIVKHWEANVDGVLVK